MLSETLEAQLSRLEDNCEKLMADVDAFRTKCDQFRLGYRYSLAKVVRYLAKLSFVPWL